MFFKKSNKQQSGRSMVEMLGVLAIIGVLSIGGIAGYTLSMRRYRANQVIDAMSKYALIVYGACQQYIINGTIQDLSGCGSVNEPRPPTYNEANLGTVADVIQIRFGWIEQTDTGVDNVVVWAEFKDNEICKAAKSISGVKGNECGDPSNLHIPFKFN